MLLKDQKKLMKIILKACPLISSGEMARRINIASYTGSNYKAMRTFEVKV
jgi:hypothetical protein